MDVVFTPPRDLFSLTTRDIPGANVPTQRYLRNTPPITYTSTPQHAFHSGHIETNFVGDISRIGPSRRFVRESTMHPGDNNGALPAPSSQNCSHASTTNFIGDIDGSSSRIVLFNTARCVDPLSPAYQCASAPAYPPPELPFKRDLYSVRDIDGAYAKKYVDRIRTTQLEEIPGSRSLPRTRSRRDKSANHADVRDINGLGGPKRPHEMTDPLSPVYKMHGRVVCDSAGRGGNHPSPPRAWRGGPNYSLLTADIDGATCTSASEMHSVGGIPMESRRSFLVTNRIEDIPGAQAGSRMRGPPRRAMHATDPNERDYVLLEGRTWAEDELRVGAPRMLHASALLRSQIAAATTAQFAKRTLQPATTNLTTTTTTTSAPSSRRAVSLPPVSTATVVQDGENIGDASGSAGLASVAAREQLQVLRTLAERRSATADHSRGVDIASLRATYAAAAALDPRTAFAAFAAAATQRAMDRSAAAAVDSKGASSRTVDLGASGRSLPRSQTARQRGGEGASGPVLETFATLRSTGYQSKQVSGAGEPAVSQIHARMQSTAMAERARLRSEEVRAVCELRV